MLTVSPNLNVNIPAHTDLRQLARYFFSKVTEEVALGPKLRESVRLDERGRLILGEVDVDLTAFERLVLVAIGKAAVPMAEHIVEILPSDIAMEGLVVGTGDWNPPAPLRYIAGSHPVPDENSFVAAEQLLDLMHKADEKTLVLFLISGGSSAMVETPFDPAISHEDIISFYRTLLHSGLPIDKMNALRKHLSAVKGGRLACAAGAATKATLLISDVPEGMLHVVGSGVSCADPSTIEECQAILQATPYLNDALPESIRKFFAAMPETPKDIPDGTLPSVYSAVLSSESLIQAAEKLVHNEGYRVVIDNTCDDWDYREAASYLLEKAQEESARQLPVCILSAGEVTVSVDSHAGTGGRNQQWTLEMARLLNETGLHATVLSAGSDGIDGNSLAAGAVGDETTWRRAAQLALDPQNALDRFNTNPLFDCLGDAVVTGPLGNNLRDLRMILCPNDRQSS